MNNIDLSKISTEAQNPDTIEIDSVSTIERLRIINNEDKKVALEIEKNIDSIAKVVDKATEVIKNNGRVIYIGAGTSGRLGVLDASEILPTYGESSWFYGIIAGGDTALRHPIENAEDSLDLAKEDLIKLKLTKDDMVIGIAASGRTPYVIGGLKYANEIGAVTGSISTSSKTEISKIAKFPIEVVVGPETITGSTRMKSGTAQKLVLNMISTSVAVALGKTYQNWMVDVKSSNLKLEKRAMRMIQSLTNADDQTAEKLFIESEKNVKTAVVMFFKKVNKQKAEELLNKNNNFIRGLID